MHLHVVRVGSLIHKTSNITITLSLEKQPDEMKTFYLFQWPQNQNLKIQLLLYQPLLLTIIYKTKRSSRFSMYLCRSVCVSVCHTVTLICYWGMTPCRLRTFNEGGGMASIFNKLCFNCRLDKNKYSYLTSNLRRSAMNIPGITMSPSPNIAKLFAANPFSRRSCGNTTERSTYQVNSYCVRDILSNLQKNVMAVTIPFVKLMVSRNNTNCMIE